MSRLLRGELSSGDQYRSSNNNLYPLRISEIRPVGSRHSGSNSNSVSGSQQLYTFIPPTNSLPTNPATPPRKLKNGGLQTNGKKMTLITGVAKSDTSDGGGGIGGSSGGGPPIFLRQLNDSSIKVGTRARLLIEINPNYGGENNNGIIKVSIILYSGDLSSIEFRHCLKVTWFRNDIKIIHTLSSSSPSVGVETKPRIVQGNEGKFYFLDISEVHLEDEGKWIWLVSKDFGRKW